MRTRLQPHGIQVSPVALRERAATTDTAGLGSPGRCSGEPTLDIWIFDDSGSVTSVGGTDPLALRYREARAALRHVARACTCRKERVGILHFDADTARVRPTPIAGVGGLWLWSRLNPPQDALGSSQLMPALQVAEGWAHRVAANTAVRLVVFSDFALTDSDPEAIIARMEAFPGDVTAVVLGQGVWPGHDPQVQVRHVASSDQRGSFAQTVFGELCRHRVGVALA